jgi:hypothetical protein
MPPKPAAPPKKPGITNTQLLIGGAALLLFLGSKK